MQLLLTLFSVFLVSIISLVGVVTLAIKEKFLKTILFLLIAFSAGALLGGAFLHLIPEAAEGASLDRVFIFVIFGFISFFLLEKYLYWRHCHSGLCDAHAFTYLNLIGDSLHNFIDGLVIAGSFAVSVRVGFFTTLLVIIHEIPQELGDFGVLVYGGFSRGKALFYNFLTALTAFGGALTGYFFTNRISGFSHILLAVTAGGFLYISNSDLIPEIHKETDRRKSGLSLILFLLGIVMMYILKKIA